MGIKENMENEKRVSSLRRSEDTLFFVRRKGMSKPPVKLGVDKSYLIEKERTS